MIMNNIEYRVEPNFFKKKLLDRHTFINCTFRAVNFKGGEIYMCKFNNCTFECCFFDNARLHYSDFTTSTFKDCVGWHTAHLDFAQFNEEFKQELIDFVFKKVNFKKINDGINND